MVTWAGSYNVTDTKVANYQALNGDMVVVDLTAGPLTITAPANPEPTSGFGVHVLANPNREAITVESVTGQNIHSARVVFTIPTSSITAVVNPGTIYYGLSGSLWVPLSQERAFEPPAKNFTVLAPVVVGGAWTDLGLSIPVLIAGVYWNALLLFEDVNTLGNQSLMYAVRVLADAVEIKRVDFVTPAAAGNFLNTRGLTYLSDHADGVLTVEAMTTSPGTLSVNPGSGLQLQGPLWSELLT